MHRTDIRRDRRRLSSQVVSPLFPDPFYRFQKCVFGTRICDGPRPRSRDRLICMCFERGLPLIHNEDRKKPPRLIFVILCQLGVGSRPTPLAWLRKRRTPMKNIIIPLAVAFITSSASLAMAQAFNSRDGDSAPPVFLVHPPTNFDITGRAGFGGFATTTPNLRDGDAAPSSVVVNPPRGLDLTGRAGFGGFATTSPNLRDGDAAPNSVIVNPRDIEFQR